MARVLLIKCHEYDLDPYAVSHPLGLMYLSAWLKREGGHEVRVLDTRLRLLDADAVAAEARAFAPDVIGLSALLIEARCFHNYAAALRAALPGAAMIAGGPYPSSSPERLLGDASVDGAVIGEGEIPLQQFVDSAAADRAWHGIPGLAVRENGGVRVNPQRDYVVDLDAMPFPDWDAADLPAYALKPRFSNRKPGPYMPVFTSRSCPWNCIYCHKIFGKRFRARGPESVLEELKTIHGRYGITDFEIFDDCFNFNRDRAEQICDQIIESGMKIRLSFPNGVRTDLLDEALIKKLKRAGTISMAVALETSSPRLQKLIRKNLDLDRARHAIALAARAGIFCHGFFMLGFPTETPDEMRATIRFACKSKLHSASFFVVTPQPGTELFRIIHNADDFGINDNPNKSGYFAHEEQNTDIPAEVFEKIYKSTFFKFYVNPFRVVRILIRVPEKSFLLGAAWHLLIRMFGIKINTYNK